jgi:hypothetical protein
MGLINWIFDIYQQSRIEDLQREAQQARAEAWQMRSTSSSGGGIDASRLEKALGELALAVKTIQRIAVEKGLCTPDELQRKMREIDREDGIEDGRAPVR